MGLLSTPLSFASSDAILVWSESEIEIWGFESCDLEVEEVLLYLLSGPFCHRAQRMTKGADIRSPRGFRVFFGSTEL